MSVQFQIEEMSGYLAARFTGEGAAEEVWQQFESIAEYCRRANNNKLLLDWIGFYEGDSIVDSYFLGERAAQIFARYNLKIASVVRPEQFDPRNFGFGELVARNRGVNVRAFADIKTRELISTEKL